MDGMLQAHTAFDTWSGVVSAALYLVVGVGALARSPRDARTRTFFAIAIACLAPYLLPAAMGRLGTGRLMIAAVLVTAVSLAVGSVALYHFAQVFPARRPWIRAYGRWLMAAYGVLSVGAVIGALAILPIVRSMAEVSAQVAAHVHAAEQGGDVFGAVGQAGTLSQAVILLVVAMPAIFIIGVVLPFGGLLSLYRSWQDAAREGGRGARVTTMMILVSQLAGGVLTILIVPLLGLVAPSGPWVMVAAALLFGVGLLFPIGVAMGVWKYELISSVPEGRPRRAP